jgi:hypothetical protein
LPNSRIPRPQIPFPLDQTLPLAFRLPFCDWPRRQPVGSSRGGDGTPRGTGSILMGVVCRNLRGVAPSRLGSAASCRWYVSQGFLESRFEGVARLDALYGVRFWWLCHGEFSSVHDESSHRGRWGQSAIDSLEGIFRALDGVLFRCAGNTVFCCPFRGLLHALRSTCDASSVRLEAASNANSTTHARPNRSNPRPK